MESLAHYACAQESSGCIPGGVHWDVPFPVLCFRGDPDCQLCESTVNSDGPKCSSADVCSDGVWLQSCYQCMGLLSDQWWIVQPRSMSVLEIMSPLLSPNRSPLLSFLLVSCLQFGMSGFNDCVGSVPCLPLISRAIFIFVAQVVAGIAAAAAVKGLVPGDVVLFVVNLSPGVSKVQGLFLEMFFTLLLVFAILMLAAEKTKSTFIAPIGIGLALFVAELFGVFWTGGAVNPARAFGPAVIQGFQSTHWVYCMPPLPHHRVLHKLIHCLGVGPILGGMIAAGIYKLFKFLNYEEVNGTQDLTPAEEEDVERAEKRKMHKRRSSRRHSTHNGDRSEKGYRSDREGDRSERGYRSDREDPESANTIVPAKPSTGHAPPPRRSAQYDAPIVYDYNGKPYYQDPNAQAPSTGPYVLHPQSAPAQAAKPPRSSKTYI